MIAYIYVAKGAHTAALRVCSLNNSAQTHPGRMRAYNMHNVLPSITRQTHLKFEHYALVECSRSICSGCARIIREVVYILYI